ncbi:OLC1v1021885C1 [Oldenlandia corymbosa var. corymbosa]|uniref:OLC1v1021885C1 n=1 Tax=Oldenlandia corymbosa var. corymbosa TaxID=529605 RepID=A0AAV1C0D5_OLDCO|nr:OLC1v1021885C1 [Oldenlandia corymbosa var. corymbosa]
MAALAAGEDSHSLHSIGQGEDGFTKRKSISVATLGRCSFKKQGAHQTLTSTSVLLPLSDDLSQIDSDVDDLCMIAKRAVSESDIPDLPQMPLRSSSVHSISTAAPDRHSWPLGGGNSIGWRMKVEDDEFDEEEDSVTLETSTNSRKRGSDDSLTSLERPGKKKTGCEVDEEVKNLFKALEVAWESGGVDTSAKAQLNGFAMVEPDQLPLFK